LLLVIFAKSMPVITIVGIHACGILQQFDYMNVSEVQRTENSIGRRYLNGIHVWKNCADIAQSGR
jgi:hypothetical protein